MATIAVQRPHGLGSKNAGGPPVIFVPLAASQTTVPGSVLSLTSGAGTGTVVSATASQALIGIAEFVATSSTVLDLMPTTLIIPTFSYAFSGTTIGVLTAGQRFTNHPIHADATTSFAVVGISNLSGANGFIPYYAGADVGRFDMQGYRPTTGSAVSPNANRPNQNLGLITDTSPRLIGVFAPAASVFGA